VRGVGDEQCVNFEVIRAVMLRLMMEAVIYLDIVYRNTRSYILQYHDINPLQPSGYYMYRQFNIQQFYVLPTQCIYVFCVDLRIYSDYFSIQH
jgi:transglutaminase/protease-like cytokinesis protein 3